MTAMDDNLMAALRATAQHRMSHWANRLEKHRRHPSFRIQHWPFTLEWGFTCECSGQEKEWRIKVSALRDLLPGARASVRRIFEARQEQRRGAKKARRDQRRINSRARALLYQHLTREQKWELRASKAFSVTGQDGRTYLITEGTSHNVQLMESGRAVYSLCIVAKERGFPMYDLMLVQKFLLESDIGTFLRTAHCKNLETKVVSKNGAFLLGEGTEDPREPPFEVIPIEQRHLDEPETWVRERLQLTG